MAVFPVTMALVVMVNRVAISGLVKGREVKSKLLNGLVKLYRDQSVSEYYDQYLLEAYSKRFTQYIIGIAATGVASIAIPVIVLITSE